MSRFLSWVAPIWLLLLGGCIEFEDQKLNWRYQPKKDEILITLRYQGIHGGDGFSLFGKDKPAGVVLSLGQQGQIDKVMEGGRAFFFSNWLSEIDVPTLKEIMEDEDEKILKSVRDAVGLLVNHTEITNVGFYLDAKGRLCGAQTLRFGKASEILRAGSQAILESLILERADKYWAAIQGSNPESFTKAQLEGYLAKLEEFSYGRIQVLDIKEEGLGHRFQIGENGKKFWVSSKTPNRGFYITHIDQKEGYATLDKYGISTKINLATMAISPDPNNISLGTMKRLVGMAIQEESLFKLRAEGLSVHIPISREEYNALNENQDDSAVYTGVSLKYVHKHLVIDFPKATTIGMDGAKAYTPNALEYIRTKYGLKEKSKVNSRIADFMRQN